MIRTLLVLAGRHVWQPILAVLMALRATRGDENPQRTDTIRPQDAILPHIL
jgi:hypothetical protein